jgi:transcriptional regulator with XRE-family HTH domain
MVGQDFRRWFAEQLRRRGWNQADFVRESGFATGTVSRWINGSRLPDPASIDLIADVLGADVKTVMVLAGHLPKEGPIDPDDPVERICGMVRRLKPDEGQVETLEVLLASWLRQKRDQRQR